MLPEPVPDNSRERERERERERCCVDPAGQGSCGFSPAWKKEKVSQAETWCGKLRTGGGRTGRTMAGLLLTDNLSELEEEVEEDTLTFLD